MAKLQKIPQELDIKNGAVYTKIPLHRGIKYGPYAVKWNNEPMDKEFSWEVRDFQFTIICT